MTETATVPDDPQKLVIRDDGELAGATGRYRKSVGDLEGLYLDDAAWRSAVADGGPERLAYSVEEHRYHSGDGALVVGTSSVLPGLYGTEFAMTRGHLHAIADRAELYRCLSGHGGLLLDTVDGRSEFVELTPGEAVTVPGHWIHRSVNLSLDEPFVTLFCYSADAGQDYEIIADAGGMRTLVVRGPDGAWSTSPNPRHRGYARAGAERAL